MRRFNLIILSISILVGFQNCEPVNVTVNDNQGFLAYSSGIGISEGVKITTWSGGYILLGSTDTGFEKDYFIVKTDNEGNILVSKVFLGDAKLDNIPRGVLVRNDLIYVLGDRFDRIVNRVIPYISSYSLSDLVKTNDEIYLDGIRELGAGSDLYEELSTDFFIDGSVIYIATTSNNFNDNTSYLLYAIDLDGQSDSYYDEGVALTANLDTANIQIKAIKKGENGFYLVGATNYIDTSGKRGLGYFIEKYDLNGNPQGSYYNEDFFAFTSLLDFEEIRDDKLVVFYREGMDAFLEIIELTGDTNNLERNVNIIERKRIGELFVKDQVIYDGNPLNIIDETRSGTIQKIDDKFIITGIASDTALFVGKVSIDVNTFAIEFDWGDPWKTYNKTSIFHHGRNTVGNAVSLNDGKKGYAIIGTHDFINDTKMIFMQLDEKGNYYKDE